MKINLRILLKALRKSFTSITLVGFIQFLILGLILSVLFAVLLEVFFNIIFLWSGYPFVIINYFINRLILVSKTIDEEKVDITVLSEEVDKEKTTLLSRVLKKTFSGRFNFLITLLLAFGFTVYFGFLEIFYLAVPIGLLAIYLIRFIHSFLTDESGFYRPNSSSRWGGSVTNGADYGGGGGDYGGGGGDCGGGGGDCGGD